MEAIQELMDRAEAMTRARLSEIPDGSYTCIDYLDNDGVDLDQRIVMQATVTIKGLEMYCDFTDTSPQVRGPLNCVLTAVIAGAYYVVRTITDPAIPNNGGCYRSVHLHLPEGTVVNPHPPAAVNARTAIIICIADVLHGALVQAMPGKLPAASSGQLLVASFGVSIHAVSPCMSRVSWALAGWEGVRIKMALTSWKWGRPTACTSPLKPLNALPTAHPAVQPAQWLQGGWTLSWGARRH
jgi:N-methylhydantoinase B